LIVVTLARKPLPATVAATAVQYGTGALNIGACRIPVGGEVLQGGAGGLLSNVRDNTEWGHHAGPGDNGYKPSTDGRWPANVILQHRPNCSPGRTVEVKVGKSPEELGSRPGGFGDVGASRGTSRPNAALYGNAQGVEQVTIWDCEPGCPAAGLDEQHGETGGGYRVTTENEEREDESSWRLKPTVGTVRDFGDRGRVSRYFKALHGKVE
jgi:hypothetical protein